MKHKVKQQQTIQNNHLPQALTSIASGSGTLITRCANSISLPWSGFQHLTRWSTLAEKTQLPSVHTPLVKGGIRRKLNNVSASTVVSLRNMELVWANCYKNVVQIKDTILMGILCKDVNESSQFASFSSRIEKYSIRIWNYQFEPNLNLF